MSHEVAGPVKRFLAEQASIWQRHPGLVWSNRHADEAVRIRAALMRPRFPVLLGVAVSLGIERLEKEWAILCVELAPESRRVEPMVSQILENIRRGYEQARS